MNDCKTCWACKTEKPLGEFYVKVKNGEQKYSARCKQCVRLRTAELHQQNKPAKNLNRKRYRARHPGMRLKEARKSNARRWGLDPNQVLEVADKHSGKCDICQQPCSTGHYLAMDHCHTTGSLRGFLCNSCNLGLGYFGDNQALLERAIGYLRQEPLVRRNRH